MFLDDLLHFLKGPPFFSLLIKFVTKQSITHDKALGGARCLMNGHHSFYCIDEHVKHILCQYQYI
jgi:hypothetical protein